MDRARERPQTVGRPALLVDGSDEAFREMLHDLLAFGARLDAVRARFGAFIGLSGVQYTILIAISQLAGRDGTSPKDVAAHLSLSPPFVTTETAKLVRLGLVAKRPDAGDLRRVRLTVTDEARRRLAALAPLQREINDTIFAPIAADEFERIRHLARALRTSAERAVALSEDLVSAEGRAA